MQWHDRARRKNSQPKDALIKVEEWRTAGHKLVFTNGCFDLLHPGHIQYLRSASKKGQRLIIGINSDDSVRRLKGDRRPIISLEARMIALAAYYFVHLIVPFAEDTPENLIRILNPDVLIKGGDYEISEIVGADHVRSIGGRVETIPFVEGYSSSNIIQKIIDRYGKDS